MTTPTPGSIAYLRMWHGDHLTRGREVTVAGREARVLSAQGAHVAVRDIRSGRRAVVRPAEIYPNT